MDKFFKNLAVLMVAFGLVAMYLSLAYGFWLMYLGASLVGSSVGIYAVACILQVLMEIRDELRKRSPIPPSAP